MEHTALTVVMQVYEDGNARLPWAISDAAGAEYQAMARLHQQLVPYNAMLMRRPSSRARRPSARCRSRSPPTPPASRAPTTSTCSGPTCSSRRSSRPG